MGIKYATQGRKPVVGSVVPISHDIAIPRTDCSIRLADDQLLALVAGSIFSAGDCTIELAVLRAKILLAAAKRESTKPIPVP